MLRRKYAKAFHSLQTIQKWASGSPLSYQLPFAVNYPTQPIISYVNELEFNITGTQNNGQGEPDELNTTQGTPAQNDEKRCFSLLFYNLAEPSWIHFSCAEKAMNHVLCYTKQNESHSEQNKKRKENIACLSSSIILFHACFELIWFVGRNTTKDFCEQLNVTNTFAYISDMFVFKRIFEATSLGNQIPHILAENGASMHRFACDRFHNQFECTDDKIEPEAAKGFFACKYNKVEHVISLIIFYCSKGGYISTDNVCDGIHDCPNDQTDESDCVPHQPTSSSSNKTMVYGSHRRVCPDLFHMTKEGNCEKYNGITTARKEKSFKDNVVDVKASHFTLDETYIDFDVFTVIFEDDDNDDDEVEKEIFVPSSEMGNFFSCIQEDMIPCTGGHSVCFYINEICQYRLNSQSNLVPCGNGGHLHNCSYVECNSMFKCTYSYCVQSTYVCDGKWDCAEGEDETEKEMCEGNQFCKFLYKCSGTKHKCIYLQEVCDKKQDCPAGDDEYLCHLKDFICPHNCACLIQAIECRDTPQKTDTPFPFMSISISDSNLISLNQVSLNLGNASVIKLSKNFFQEICNYFEKPSLLILQFDKNCVKILSKCCFSKLNKLKALDVDDNQISLMEAGTFYNLSSLRFLNLSNNPLYALSECALHFLSGLRLLHVINLTLQDTHINAFQGMNAKIIITDDHHLCCIASNETLCLAHQPWYISCGDILPDKSMYVSFVVMFILTLLTNTTSILTFLFYDKTNKCFSTTALSTNINDLLCGVYLCTLWTAHQIYAGSFVTKEEEWRSSTVCFASFGIVLCYTTLTQLLLTFLSLSRLMVVVNPMSTKFKRFKFTLKSIILMYLLSILFGSVITSVVQLTNNSLTFSFCFPFVDPSGSIIVIQVLIWFIVVTQTLTSSAMIVLHVLLVYKLKESQGKIRKSKPDDDSNAALIIQLITLSLSNILCWFPANGIYMAAIFLSTYPIDLVMWSIGSFLPANAIVYPTVFLVVSIRKYIESKSKKERETQNVGRIIKPHSMKNNEIV